MSDGALIASPQAWPERARRRGALAAATLAMFVNLAWATSIATGPPDTPWGMVLLDLLPIPLTCVVLPLLGPGALRQVVASRASAPGMLAGLTVGVWTALSSIIGLWFPSSIASVGPALAQGSDPYGYASWPSPRASP